MYAVSLSTIPPRFGGLGPVLECLLAQRPQPASVFLCLPPAYRRYPGPFRRPAVASGVEILQAGADYGPATKVITAARHLRGRIDRLIYCDDDWLMPPGWAAALLNEHRRGSAVAASGYGIGRLHRKGTQHPKHCDVAQGFAGVLVDPAWLCASEVEPPEEAWPVDDIWLSGQLWRKGISIRLAPRAREGLVPAFDDQHALQDLSFCGRDRHSANLACADLLFQRYGIWPPAA